MSDTYTDSGDSTTSTRFSLTTQVKERFGNWIILLRSAKAMESNKWRIFHTFTELYILYCTLFIPTLRNYGYGEWGQIIYRVVDFPMHFLLDWIQYEGGLIISGFFMGFLLVAYVLLIITSWAFMKGKRFRKNLRTPLLFFMYLSRLFFPLFIHQVMGYMDCSLTQHLPYTTSNTLNRCSSVSCIGNPNSILIGVSATYCFLLLVFVCMSEMICSDMHPQSRHIFSHCNYWSMVILRVCSFVSIIIMFVIPSQYAFISSIVNIFCSLIAIITLFRVLPFYRTVTNSLVFGIHVGALASSCGTLVLFFVNAQFTENSLLFKGVGVGISVLIVGLAVLGLFVGMVSLEIYQQYLRRFALREVLKLRSLYRQMQPTEENGNLGMNAPATASGSVTATGDLNVNHVANKRLSIDMQSSYTTADSTYQQFMLNARGSPKHFKKGLLLLLRLDLINQTSTVKDLEGESVKIHEIAMRLSKNILQRGFDDRQILETVAMLFAFRHTGSTSSLTVAVELLLKSQKLSNFFTSNFATIKIIEIQSLEEAHKSEGIISRGYSKLQLVKKNSELIMALHKDFFKELMNDPIKVSSIKSIMSKISELSQSTEAVFKQLLAHKTKKLLIMYASYVELAYFDKETAHALYLEANSLEENRPTKLQKYKTSRILPQPNSKEENLSEQGSFQKRVPSFFSDNESISQHQLLDDVFEESASNAGGGGELKKDYLFRNALKTEKSNTVLKSFYVTFLLLGFCIILGSIGLSTYQGTIIKRNIVNLRLICVPQIAPISTIRNLRAFQNWVNVFGLLGMEWPLKRSGYVNEIISKYVEGHVQVLDEDISILENLIKLGQSVVFDASTYTAYGKSQHTFKIPSVNGSDYWSKKQFTGIPELRTVSIIEITNSLLQYMKEMKDSLPVDDLDLYFNTTNQHTKNEIHQRILNSTLLNPINDFNFMLLWENMDSASTDFKEFCLDFMEKSNNQANNMIFQFEYYFVGTLGFYILLGLVFSIFLQYELSFTSRLIRVLDKQIGKDLIGKVYQTLSSKTDTEASLRMSIFSRVMRSHTSVIVVVICISFIIPLCVGLMFYESRANIKNAMFTYTNVALSSQCLQYLQMSSFYMTELLTYFVLPTLSYTGMTSPTNGQPVKYGHPFFKEYDFVGMYAQIRNQADNLSANWNELIYGDVNKPDDDPVIGLYPVLDALLVDVSNCSLYLEQRSIESTYQNYLEYCAGIENIVTMYLTKSSQVSELTRDHYIEQMKNPSKLVDPLELYLQHNDLFRMSIPMTKKLQIYMQEFVRVSSELSIGFLVGFSIFGFLGPALLGYLLFRVLENYWDSLQKTRMMLNYIALDNIDRNETLRNLVLYHSYPNVILDKINQEKTKHETNSNLESLTEMINKHIDGTILIDQLGDIEAMNNAAHRMFGSKSSDFLGAQCYKLFEEKCLEPVKKAFDSILDAAKKANETSSENRNMTESLEVDCLRLNQTKFPSKISFFSMNIAEKGLVVVCTIKDITSETKQKTLLEEEKKNSETLLKNILPEGVAARLKKGETFIAEKLNDITCFFSDMVGFTKISSNMQATDLVQMLNFVVNGFDKLTEKYDLEKIKTIGDAYFVTGGLKGCSDHPENMLRFAIDTFDVIKEFNQSGNLKEGVFLNIRIGINTGACIAGVIGIKKFAYDLWGDTINTASRMESTGVPGRIQISRATYERVYDLGLEFEERQVEVKGKGLMQAYLLGARHHTNPVTDLISKLDTSKLEPQIDEVYDLSVERIPHSSVISEVIQQAETPTQ